MTTDTLNKPVSTRRETSPPPRGDSLSKPPRYEVGSLPQPIEYPDSDGQPMAESDFQFEPLSYAVQSLKVWFQNRPDVYVSGNIFLYYEEGEPSEVVAPDVLVVIGAENRKRRIYKLWEEPKAPDFILEVTSRSTRSKDQGTKLGLYQLLGVTEYFCYDPTADYLKPSLVGYRLQDGSYVSIPAKEVTPGKVIVPSSTLQLDLQAEKDDFHFVDPATGEVLRNLAEAEAERVAAEARIRELEAQLAALKKSE